MIKHSVQKLYHLSTQSQLFEATKPDERGRASSYLNPGLFFAVLFIACAGLVAGFYVGNEPGAFIIIFAAMLGAYMALNIGANDVANNVGPAVGSGAISLVLAVVLAFAFEAAGALIAGGEVVSTIKKGIIDPASVSSPQEFVWVMMAALLSAAIWVNLATFIRAPVSTTHSIVGGLLGAGIAASGLAAVNLETMGKIASSWVISPVLGGVIAAGFLALIKAKIIYRKDKIAAARTWLPVLVSLMVSVFACYLILKGLKKIWRPDPGLMLLIGGAIFIAGVVFLRPWVEKKSQGLENRIQNLKGLFHLPLVFAAALLSFAHGANDVANAIGPLAAIIHATQTGGIANSVGVPFWVMLTGALGLSIGLLIFGPRLIRMVGTSITRLNPIHAFCVALSSAITVIIASWLGLPVSSTHIAVGAVFGIGFFREIYVAHSPRRRRYLHETRRKNHSEPQLLLSPPNNVTRRKLLRRGHFTTIISAWLITVPAAALLSAGLYTLLSLLAT